MWVRLCLDQCKAVEERVSREKQKINELIAKVTAVDQEFTEVDMSDLNTLKQSVMACQRQIDFFKEHQPTELVATPRPQVLLSSIAQSAPEPASPGVSRQSRSRPRSQRAV